jgi:hypothetical protein
MDPEGMDEKRKNESLHFSAIYDIIEYMHPERGDLT